jgi:hypothetical protein
MHVEDSDDGTWGRSGSVGFGLPISAVSRFFVVKYTSAVYSVSGMWGQKKKEASSNMIPRLYLEFAGTRRYFPLDCSRLF